MPYDWKPNPSAEYYADIQRSAPPPFSGCATSIVGAILFGIILPTVALLRRLNTHDDPGGLLFWPMVMILGGIFGTVAGPLFCLLLRIAGRLVRSFTRTR